MNVQVLVAAMNKEPRQLVQQMNIESDAIIINQCNHFSVEEWEHHFRQIKCFNFGERGVGLSRNNALMRADRDICLFSDEDIVYRKDYETLIIQEFERNPDADMLIFNVEVDGGRKTYYNTGRKRVRFYNCGRYGAVSFAVRTRALHESRVTFSLLFGGGAKYSNGEDSLFIKEFMDKGYHVYTTPVIIGRETVSISSWFEGYNEKFFTDRGVLYHFLYGKWAVLMAYRFLFVHKGKMCQRISVKQAVIYMKQGIHQA